MTDPTTPRWTAWAGEASFDEVLFVEMALQDGRRLWLRHTLRADQDVDAAGRRVWAVLSDATSGAVVHIRRAPLGEPDDGGSWRAPDAFLSAQAAHGRCGDLAWDLTFANATPGHTHVPRWMTTLGLGRTYASHTLRVDVRGTLDTGRGPQPVTGRGVIGHIHGRRNRTAAWTWAWASEFVESEATFEGLTARIGSPRAPALTSLVLDLDGERHAFSDTGSLVTTWSTFGNDGWRAQASRRGVRLTVEARPGGPASTLRYDDPPNAPILCTNAAGAWLRLQLHRPGKPPHTLTTTTATLEFARRVGAAVHDGSEGRA